ncbi:peroxisomal membrane protein Pex3, putative [Cordyceps militaris CM01]|uniref:Peroxisomal membrane protein Pex3, putative n=1 Tax=Cordyceps militaris (strain CM01) TaxID=983644 RepID=G3JAW4_CORMM|nr:peroxisomal membrane protein Pex3, putative [Cordyceps militaris CM01]EGX94377.1 peroxisomal membrane protein Pex3, putative [Cordyceps militaris CM01]
MISSVRGWLRRNRTPIAIGAGIVGAGYVVSQYVMSKISDARERMTSERISKEKQNSLRRRFEQNQEDCTFTVLALLPTATANVLAAMNTEQITYEIQQAKTAKAVRANPAADAAPTPPSIADTALTEDDASASKSSVVSESGVHASQASLPPLTSVPEERASVPEEHASAQQESAPSTKPRRSKRQLWDDLIISSVTRSFTLIYTLALLTMLTRVQLNLLGRRSYLSSVVALATGTQSATISLENNDDDNTDQAYGSDFDTNRKYLTFSWWLLNKGWVDIMTTVDGAVRAVFGTLQPRDLVSFDRLADLVLEVRRKVEGGTPEERRGARWLPYLLPPQDQEDEVIRQSGILEDNSGVPLPAHAAPESLRRLLDETADLVESPAFCHVLTLLLDAGFSTLVDKKLAAEAFELPVDESGFMAPVITESKQTKVVLLPKILSVLTRQAHVIGHGVPNTYLQDMEAVGALEAFAAVVYSSNWESEMRGAEGMPAETSGSSSSTPVPATKPAPGEKQTLANTTQVDRSIVMVDNQGSFESAWEKAVEAK